MFGIDGWNMRRGGEGEFSKGFEADEVFEPVVDGVAEGLIPDLCCCDTIAEGESLEGESIVDFYHIKSLTFLAELLRDRLQKQLLDLGLRVAGVLVLLPNLATEVGREELVEQAETGVVLALRCISDPYDFLRQQIGLNAPVLSQLQDHVLDEVLVAVEEF